MTKRNCWEYKKCGREPGGENVEELGVCPAVQPSEFDGINGGVCSGRFCWGIAETLCDGSQQGSFAKKLMSCIECEFFKEVQDEESQNFSLTPEAAREKKKQEREMRYIRTKKTKV